MPGGFRELPPARGVAQPGRAPALGAGSRQFESGRPDSFILNGLGGIRGSSLAMPARSPAGNRPSKPRGAFVGCLLNTGA